ncbi:jg25801 [Pararge aegeria aegeria]|uniref:Jg25801 protein n=1 Tax=Pararge aegeria aegeria TaxID=348720 RepID=A0A8S4S155_9NEOP|nr:jg25801 [Pararge aegeria aegeria]
MLQDDLQSFVQNLYKYLVSEEECTMGMLVKKHSTKLQTQGDFSFLNTATAWQEFLCDEQLQRIDGTLLKCVDKDIADLIKTSKDWPIRIEKAVEVKNRIHLFLDRQRAIRAAFQSAINNHAEILKIISTDTTVVKIDPYCINTNCITYLRLKCTSEVLKNLYLIRSYPKIQNLIIVVTWRSSYKYLGSDMASLDVQSVFCGTVLNARTCLKEKSVTASEYIRLRQDELTLIAQHKYGLRVSTEEKWKDFIAYLGESAVAFELLQTKCSSPVKIQFDASGGSSKGAAFILYNGARLESIIRTFEEKVAEGSYPSLPSLENTDLSLLTDEDEWSLIFTYIMGLPSLLDSSVCVDESTLVRRHDDRVHEFRPHLICKFLSNMVKRFSQYYRRVRILTEPRQHLLPVLYARIHMLTILNNTLKLCLRILNIKSVSQMYIMSNRDFINMSIADLIQAAEYIERRERESEHGYASSLPAYEETRAGGRRPKTKKSQGSRTTHNELEKNSGRRDKSTSEGNVDSEDNGSNQDGHTPLFAPVRPVRPRAPEFISL